MGDLAADTAALIGLGVALVLYGVYTVVFCLCIYVLRGKPVRNNIVWITIVALYILVSAHTALDFVDMYHTFVTYRDSVGTLYYLDHYPKPIVATNGAIWWLSATTADGLLMWRLYMVWLRNRWVCVIPGICYVASTVSGGFLLTYHILQTFPGGPERYHVYANRVTTWLGLFTLLTNVMVTGLIAARLWWVGRTVVASKSSRRLYYAIIKAVIESAALYSLTIVAYLGLHLLGCVNAAWMILLFLPVMAGIIPSLIVLQLNFNTKITSQTVVTRGDVSTFKVAKPSGMTSYFGTATSTMPSRQPRDAWESRTTGTAVTGVSNNDVEELELDVKSPGSESDLEGAWHAELRRGDKDVERESQSSKSTGVHSADPHAPSGLV